MTIQRPASCSGCRADEDRLFQSGSGQGEESSAVVGGPTAPDAPAAARHCPVEAAIALIGGKYKALILWQLNGKTLRFSELRREIPRATPKMLTQQLRELEADGLIRREVFAVVPPRVEYSLTMLGGSIRPVLQAMYAWGGDYLRLQGLEPNCSMRPLP